MNRNMINGINVGGGDRNSVGDSVLGGQASELQEGRRTLPPVRVPFKFSQRGNAGAAVSYTLDGAPNKTIWITSLVVAAVVASPTSDVRILITDGVNGQTVWEEVIPAASIIGTRVGWIRDHRPFPLRTGESYLLTVSAPGGTSRVVVNTDGYME